MKTFKNSLFLAAFALLASFTAMAETATTTMNLSASVTNSCSITADALPFGQYDPTSPTAASGTGTVRVTCTMGAPLTITLGEGANADPGSSADLPLRRLSSGTDFLGYSLYQDAPMTTIWGDTEGTGKASEGLGSEESHSVYAKIPEGQNVPAGNYTDSVMATVTF